MMLDASFERILICLFTLLVIVPPVHEIGHLWLAKVQNIEVLKYELIGLNPHVRTYTDEINIPFLAGGQLLMIPLLCFYSYAVDGITYTELIIFIGGMICGSYSDIVTIFQLA